MPELIILMIVFLAILVGSIIALVWYFSSRRKPLQPPAPPSIQDKLVEIDALRSNNLITGAEHEEKRKMILNRI